MNLEFGKLIINNFKSFDGEHVIDLERGGGVHFVKGVNNDEPRLGSNGAGKSGLFDALAWAIYGRTTDGRKRPDLEPWRRSGKTTVGIYVQGKLLERATRPNSLSYDKREVDQSEIERMVMPFGVFKNTVLLGQGQPLFVDLSPRDKMSLLSEALELDRWDARAAHANELSKELRITISNGDANLLSKQELLKELNINFTNVKHSRDNWEDELSTGIKKRQLSLKNAEKEFDEWSDRVTRLDLALDKSETEAKAHSDRFSKLMVQYQKERERARGSEVTVEVLKQKVEQAKQAAKINVCPTCGQKTDGNGLRKAVIAAEKILGEFVEEEGYRKQERLIVKLEKQIEVEQKLRNEFENEVRQHRSTLNMYKPSLQEAKFKIESLKEAVRELEQSTNPFDSTLKDLRSRRDKVKDQLEEIKIKLKPAKQRLKRVDYWVNGFKDIRLFIIEEVLAELTLCSNAMLERMGMIGWGITYATEKDTLSGTVQRGLNVTITSPRHQQPVKFESWSGGEAQRLRLIVSLALSEVLLNHAGKNPSIEILDEPTTHLSSEGTLDLCEMLASRAEQVGRTILIADHMVVESSLFASTITVEKDKKGSHIVEEV